MLTGWTGEECDVVGRCLRAAAGGPFFPEEEFHALFGLDRAEVAAIAADWPDVDWIREDVRLAVGNSLVNLTGYPHGQPEQFRLWLGVPFADVDRLAEKWRANLARTAESDRMPQCGHGE